MYLAFDCAAVAEGWCALQAKPQPVKSAKRSIPFRCGCVFLLLCLNSASCGFSRNRIDAARRSKLDVTRRVMVALRVRWFGLLNGFRKNHATRKKETMLNAPAQQISRSATGCVGRCPPRSL